MITYDVYQQIKALHSDSEINLTSGDWSVNLTARDLLLSLKVPPKPVTYIPIHISQWATEANSRRNDCGPTCVAMHLRVRGDSSPVNALRVGDPTGLTNATDLQKLLKAHGVNSEIQKISATAELSTALNPYSLLLVNCAPLKPYTQDSYTGWHWLIYVGPDLDNPSLSVVLDPNYWGDRATEGDHKRYPTTALREAFRPYAGAGNLATALYVFDEPAVIDTSTPRTVKITADPTLNIRSGPDTDHAIIGKVKKDMRVVVYSELNGWLQINAIGSVVEQWINKVYTVDV